MSPALALAAAAVAALLAAVFLVSGVAKLADPPAAARSLRGFGVRAGAGPLGVGLGLIEPLAAFALLSGGLELYGALGVTALGILFSIGIGWNLARGRRPECGCFGSLASSRISAASLARSVALAVAGAWITVLAWAHGGVGPAYWLAEQAGGGPMAGRAAALELGVVICLVAMLAIHRKTILSLRISISKLEGTLGPFGVPGLRGLAMGTPAPDFSVACADGQAWTLGTFLEPGKPLVLFFVDPHSAACRSLAADIAEWQAEHGRRVTLGVLSDGPAAAAQDALGTLRIFRLGLQSAHEVRDAYGCPATPGAVVLSPDGRVASPVTVGGQAVRELWLAQLRRASAPAGPAGPASAPAATAR